MPPHLRMLRDPKPRVIAKAPFEDRVVHTALVRLAEPAVTRSLLPEAFACRPGFGQHRALLHLYRCVRRYRHALHLDIRSYFPSIHIEILQGLLRKRIRDARFLEVLDRVLEGGRGLYDPPHIRRFARLPEDWPPKGQGLPIGAWTSQVLASHLYLDGLDHFVKRDLKVPGYGRYVDDLFFFANRRSQLRRARTAVGRWLWEKRRLKLKHPHARILSCHGRLDALGYRVTRREIRPLPRTLNRMKHRLHQHLEGDGPDVQRSMASTAGVWMFGV